MNSWVLHDSYKTEATAKKYGKDIMETGLAKGIKIVLKKDKKKKLFELHVLPLN